MNATKQQIGQLENKIATLKAWDHCHIISIKDNLVTLENGDLFTVEIKLQDNKLVPQMNTFKSTK